MPTNQPQKKSSSNQSQLSTFKRVLILLGAILAMFAIIGIINIIIALVNFSSMKSTINDQVNAARIENGSEISQKRIENIQKYSEQGIVNTTQPIYSSTVDACYLAHVDSGWIIDYYYQECYLRYIDVFNASLTKDQYTSLVKASDNKRSESNTVKRSSDKCNDDRLMSGIENGTDMVFVAADGTTSICTLPNPINGDRVVTYAVNSVVSTQSETGDSQQFTGDKDTIVVTADYSYYKKDIGCKPLTLFCESPIETVIVGNMKTVN